MEQKKLGVFEVDLNTLPEAKPVKEILESKNDKIENHFTEVDCVISKRQFNLKDGSKSDPTYSLVVKLHSSIEEKMDNKKMINAVEFTLIQLEFLKPVDVNEIKFKGYVRFLRGISDSPNIRSDDKSFITIELFISENLSSISAFLNNGTKLLMNRLSKLNDAQLKTMKCLPLNNFKQFKLVKTEALVNELTEGE